MSNDAYHRWHKPDMSDTARTSQGYYKITNLDKYIGDPIVCIYRSSWEFAFCKFCDFSTSIKRWSAEPIHVPYYDRTGKLAENVKLGLDPNNPANWVVRNYHVDFWMEIDKGNGVLEKWFVEIKPSYKLKKPVPPKSDAPLKIKRRFNTAAKEYLINEAKFASCKAWAEKNNSKFFIFTEQTMSNILARFGYKKSSDD